MLPSVALRNNRPELIALVACYHCSNPRIFGSVLHGTDTVGSDLDLLVDAQAGVTLFDLGGLQMDLTELLKVPVHLLTTQDISPNFREAILAEAKPIRVLWGVHERQVFQRPKSSSPRDTPTKKRQILLRFVIEQLKGHRT